MSRLKLSEATRGDEPEEGKWHTLEDDIRIKVRPWVRTSQTMVDKRSSDKEFVKALNIPWDELPRGTGNRRVETRTVVLADYLVEEVDNVEMPDGTVLREGDYVPILAKVLLFEHTDVAPRIVAWAQEGGGAIVEDEVKN